MRHTHHLNLQEQRKGFSDNHDAVHAELEHQLSRRNPGPAAVLEQPPVNNPALYFEHHLHSQDASQSRELSFDYNQGSFAPALDMLDSDPRSLDNSPELTLGPVQESPTSPDFSSRLLLSLDDL